MKKIIGILGIVAIAMTMFFSLNNSTSSDGNLSMSSLLAMNTANAEEPSNCFNYCYQNASTANWICTITWSSGSLSCPGMRKICECSN